MILSKDNIGLRAVEPEDLNVLYNWENDMALWVVSNTQVPFSRFQLKQYIENGSHDIYECRQVRLMIVLKEEKGEVPVGMVDLFDFEPFHNRAGVGIMINQAYRNKGFAAIALELFSKYCFSHLALHQIYCTISETNSVSRLLFEKAGFQLVGVKKEWLKEGSRYVDEYFYQKLNR